MKVRTSEWKFARLTNVTGRSICPSRYACAPGITPWKGEPAGRSSDRGDAHGVEGVDVEDVEATASVHQHLGKALLADDGVDDERVASWSRDVGGMVPLIEGDRRFRPAEEGGDGRLGSSCLSIANLVLALGPDGIGSTEDHDAFVSVGETISVLAHHPSFLGCRLFAVPFFRPAGLS